MNKMAHRLFDYTVIYNINNEELRDEQVYAIEVLLGKVLTYGSLIFLAIIFNVMLPTIIFMSIFFPLRARTGGYHAKSFSICYLSSMCIYIILVWFIIPVLMFNGVFMAGILFISIITIFLFSPVDHPNLQLSEKEKVYCKKSSKWFLLFISLGIGFAYVMNVNLVLITYAIIAIGLDAALILIAKIKKGNEVI